MPDMDRRFSPAQLRPFLGVSESTIKRWVDSGKLRSVKTAGGHRRIAVPDLLDFLRAGGREVPGLEALGLGAGPGRRGEAEALTPARLAQFLLEGEMEPARTFLLTQFSSGRAVEDLLDRLVAPAMVEVGRLWERKEIDVYREHLATQRAWRILLELRGLLPAVPPGAPLALGAAPEGDPYLLPALMAETTLAEMRWRTLNLGADVPVDSLRLAVARHRPRLVWLSVTSSEITPGFLAGYPALFKAVQEQGAGLVLGGQGLTPALQDQLIATAFGTRLAHLKAFATSWRRAGRGRRRPPTESAP
jgi:excisionase family DNA binding protein